MKAIHPHSVESAHALPRGTRQEVIYNLIRQSKRALSDRQIMEQLGFRDMNAVRPRITEMLRAKLLEEGDEQMDQITNRYVRTVRLYQPRDLFRWASERA